MKKIIWINENKCYEITCGDKKINKEEQLNKKKINKFISLSDKRIDALKLLFIFFGSILCYGCFSMGNTSWETISSFHLLPVYAFTSGLFMVLSILFCILDELKIVFLKDNIKITNIDKLKDKYAFLYEKVIAFIGITILMVFIIVILQICPIDFYTNVSATVYYAIVIYLFLGGSILFSVYLFIFKNDNEMLKYKKYIPSIFGFFILFFVVMATQQSMLI